MVRLARSMWIPILVLREASRSSVRSAPVISSLKLSVSLTKVRLASAICAAVMLMLLSEISPSVLLTSMFKSKDLPISA